MLIIYTGNGKGKTTAALGLVLRASGFGKKSLLVQFLKTEDTNEVKSITEFLGKNCIVKAFGRKGFPTKKTLVNEDFELAKKALRFVKEQISNKKPDLLVLDEVNVALNYGLITKNDVEELIKHGKDIDIVITGRNAPSWLVKKANLVTEMKEIKHPFNNGVRAKQGIDF